MLRADSGRSGRLAVLLSLALFALKAFQLSMALPPVTDATIASAVSLPSPIAAAQCVAGDAPTHEAPDLLESPNRYDTDDAGDGVEEPDTQAAHSPPMQDDPPASPPRADATPGRYDDPLQFYNHKLLTAVRAPQLAPRVHVAILDGAVRSDHPDLPPLIWIEPRLREPDGRCGGQDCCPRQRPLRPSTHATSVAGLIAAVRENGHGIAGMAEVGDLVSIAAPVQERDGDLRLAAALHCAIEYRGSDGRPLRVVNMSLGLQATHGTVLRDALAAASRAGLLLVSSAGNRGRDITRLPRWPASFNSDTAITVEARRYDGALARSSNYGRGVDIGAPAPQPNEDSALCTTGLGGAESDALACAGDYGHFDRTSAAAAVVSGAAARVWRDPRYAGCSAAQLRRILLSEGRYCRDSGHAGVAPVCMLDLAFLQESRVVEDCRN